jgi:hypothetical protein
MTARHRTEWPSAPQRRENGAIMRAELESEIGAYELRFGFPSCELRGRLQQGLLKETAEICQWLIAYEAIQNLDVG